MPRKRKEEVPVPELAVVAPSEPLPIAESTTEPAPESGEAPRERKRKRGRPRKDAAPLAPGAVSEEELERCKLALAGMFGVLGKIVASRRGRHWELTDEECSALGGAWTAALAPYLSKMGAAVPWAAAAAVTYAMAVPRLKVDQELAAAKEAATTPLRVES